MKQQKAIMTPSLPVPAEVLESEMATPHQKWTWAAPASARTNIRGAMHIAMSSWNRSLQAYGTWIWRKVDSV